MITDFELYATSGNSNAVIGVAFGPPQDAFHVSNPAPRVQTGSLQFQVSGAALCVNVRPEDARRGFTRGLLQTLAYEFTFSAMLGYHTFGLYCMADRADLTSGLGKCYVFGFKNTQNATYTVFLAKCYSGVENSNLSTSVLASANGQWIPNTDLSVGLSWVASNGMTVLTAKLGLTSNFSTISTLLSVVDSSSAFSVTSGEGLWGTAGTAGILQCLFDRTTWAKK